MTPIFDLDRVLLFVLLLARAGGLVASAPFLGDAVVPRKVKILFSGVLAFLMLSVGPATPTMPAGFPGLLMLVGAELTVGIVMGFTARLLILAFEMAGQIVAIQMGLGMAQIMDPMQPYRSSLLGRWMWLVVMTCFLGFQGHHHLLRAVAGSLHVLPPGKGLLGDGVVEAMVTLSANTFASAMSIAAPAIGLLLLTSLGLGFLARTVPQMNVFIVGFPVKITVGIVAIMLSLPFVLEVARREVGDLVNRLASLVAAA